MSTQDDTKKDHLNISFDEIHSDEPHEAVRAQKTESHEPAKSHLSNHGGVFNVSKAFTEEGVEEGTIVSDKRARRHSLGESLRDAWHEWVGDAKETISDISEKVETLSAEAPPAIAPVETRKEIVEKAATHATLAPKDDSKVVIEKIRTYKKDVAQITGQQFTIKEPSIEAPSWGKSTSHAPSAPERISNEKFSTPDFRSTMVAPIVAQKIKKGIEDYEKSHAKATPSPSLQTTKVTASHVPSPKIFLGNKKDAAPAPQTVAPIVTQNVKKDLERFANPIPEKQTPASRPTLSQMPQTAEVPKYVPQPAPVATAVSQEVVAPAPVVEPPVFTKREESIIPEEAPVFTPQEVITPIPVPTYDAPLSPAPEFRSAPLPDIVKQERASLLAQEEAVVSRNSPSQAAGTQSGFDMRTFMPIILRGGAVFLIIGLGVGLAVFMKSRSSDTTSQIVEVVSPAVLEVPSLTPTDTQHEVLLSGSPQSVRETLHAQIQSGTPGLTQLYPSVSEGTYTRPATSKEFFSYLNAHIPTALERTLDDTMMIGSITTSTTEPFIIIRSSSFDQLFTGLLAWEQYLFADFSPMFGNTPPNTMLFKDAVRGNASTRILYDDAGNEVLLYSFVRGNTVIITSSSEALTTLISRF